VPVRLWQEVQEVLQRDQAPTLKYLYGGWSCAHLKITTPKGEELTTKPAADYCSVVTPKHTNTTIIHLRVMYYSCYDSYFIILLK
jgi:hypothetical protein